MPGKEKREGESTRQRGAPRFSPPAERVKPDACETPNTVIIAVMTCIYIYLYLYLSRAVCPPEKATRALYSRHTYKVHTHTGLPSAISHDLMLSFARAPKSRSSRGSASATIRAHTRQPGGRWGGGIDLSSLAHSHDDYTLLTASVSRTFSPCGLRFSPSLPLTLSYSLLLVRNACITYIQYRKLQPPPPP